MLKTGDRVGLLRDDNSPYDSSQMAVHVLDNVFKGKSINTLAKRLCPQRTSQLLRFQGMMLAHCIASAWLQLYATPWWSNFTGSDGVHLAEPDLGDPTSKHQAYLDASFSLTQGGEAQDSGFITLGIVLLELCFGQSFAEHPKWKSDAAVLNVIPVDIAQKTVAAEWLKDVQWHVGLDYAQAVSWCLNFATLRNPEWRVEFARNVLEPLQRCYDECMRAAAPRS